MVEFTQSSDYNKKRKIKVPDKEELERALVMFEDADETKE